MRHSTVTEFVLSSTQPSAFHRTHELLPSSELYSLCRQPGQSERKESEGVTPAWTDDLLGLFLVSISHTLLVVYLPSAAFFVLFSACFCFAVRHLPCSHCLRVLRLTVGHTSVLSLRIGRLTSF